jgi:drug/metabolite transporter (DMT)-like permease
VRPEVVALALTASVFTALASVAQHRAAAPAPGQNGLGFQLIHQLLHRPVWFLGIASMILGFAFQVAALRVGSLSLVQPIIATELLIVFAIIALRNRHGVHGRDWLAALGMAVALGAFLALARPAGGHDHASGSMWVLAGIFTFAVAAVLALMAYVPGAHGAQPSSSRKAALLGVAAATGFGFVAAVIKELSTHFSQGPAAVFSNWSPYVLLLSGAASMFLASHAFQAGSLAASQPGLTIVDPLVASLLGVMLFGERLVLEPMALAGEAVALAVLVGSVVLLSRSPLIRGEDPSQDPAPAADDCSERVSRRLQRIGATARGRYGLLPASAGLSGGRPLSRPAAEDRNDPRLPGFTRTSRRARARGRTAASSRARADGYRLRVSRDA